jgi:rfaE bifunctional protein kinase chain/domain
LGGAANVALNVKALGANPILCTVVGNDQKGDEFIDLLKHEQMQTTGVVKSTSRITTTKFRVIGNKVQMLRVDEEVDNPLNSKDKKIFFDQFNSIINNSNIDVIIFQDYDKGVISADVIQKIVDIAIDKEIPVAVDPKKKNFLNYRNVTLFKPNLKELKEGLNIDFDAKNKKQLKEAVSSLKSALNAGMILLTLSEDGVFIEYDNNGKKNTTILPSHVRMISDVSGAGDTVISVASLCLAAKVDPSILAAVSNLAGGLVCEKVGVVPVDKKILLAETLKLSINA